MEAPRQLSRSRRRTARHLARGLGLCAALTALLAAASPATPAGAAGGPAVVIAGPGAVRSELTGGELEAVAGTEAGPYSYVVRAHPGEAGESFSRSGVPVAKLIELTGTPLGSIGYVTLPRADGTTAYLPASDFTAVPPEEQGPALVSADSECTRFVRPLLGPEDANADDNVAACGAPLAVAVRDGRILSIHASASSTTPEAGTAVRFRATAEGAEEGEALTYAWNFGDGTSSTGASPSHTFTAAGSYRVTVLATGSDESGGEAAPLTIVVGKPTASGVGAGDKKQKAAVTEPKRGATLSQAKAAPDAVAPDAEPGMPESTEDSEGDAGGRVVGSLPSRTAGRFVQGSHDSPRAPSKKSVGVESAQEDAVPRHAEGEAEAVAGQAVAGRLVADFVDAGAAEGGGASGAQGGSESVAAAPDGGSASVPLTALIAAALLGAGVAFEWRRQARGSR
jgi:PKD repeat protein